MAELPQGARVLYRILTEKSKLGFGKFADCTVMDLLKTEQDEYLIWVYYNSSNISFKEDILDRLGVTRIAKPGKDESLWIEYLKQRKHERYAGLSNTEFMHLRNHEKAVNRKRGYAHLRKVQRSCNKSAAYMQAVNHGHIKGDYY